MNEKQNLKVAKGNSKYHKFNAKFPNKAISQLAMVEAVVAYVQIDLVTQSYNLLVTKEKHITTFNRWWRKKLSILSGYPSGKIFKYHEPSARF